MHVLKRGYQTRSYQQEMFERSMEGNSIVFMDTGSGKTQVAVLRIQAELDICEARQRVWFLAPTVELCIQQHGVLSSALPAYSHCLLTGSDNVDRWSEQSIWDAALDKQRVVVSTHAVLADALRHGFVHVSELALIVFDEAHHCVKKHAANVIMKDFYHPAKSAHGSSYVPHILGLSASLVMRSNLLSMQTIERNLDSTSKTPRIHREDLFRHVHRPTCRLLTFGTPHDRDDQIASRSFKELKELRDSLTLTRTMQQLRSQGHKSFATLDPTMESERIEATIRAFCRKTEVIYTSLGSWAADYFVSQTIRVLQDGDNGFQNLFDAKGSNRQILLALFDESQLQSLCQDHIDPGDSNISPKVKCLLSFLLEGNADDPTGIVFVEQRATTSVLNALLRRHPATKDRFRCVPFVGTSSAPYRRYGLTELVDLKAQKESLSKFRAGEHNLIIATNALEEGIDVQSCNTVVCFDPPANVKSFIQRRGRARHIRSRLAILVHVTGNHDIIRRWQSLEEELSQICQNDKVRMLLAGDVENQDEQVDYELSVPSTGAKLSADSTLQHLYHFCNQLPHRPYVEFSPEFSYQEDSSGLIGARVILPNCVSVHVRSAISQRKWRTERAAKKDAAFQAYSALYQAGLLNDNLLPLSHNWNEDDNFNEGQLQQVVILPQIDIWSKAGQQKTDSEWHETLMTVVPPDSFRMDGETDVKVLLKAPRRLPSVPPLSLHWAFDRTFTLKSEPSVPVPQPEDHDIKLLQETTLLFYNSVRSERLKCCSTNFITLLAPSLEGQGLEEWIHRNSERRKASSIIGTFPTSLVRVPYPDNPAYIFRDWSTSDEEIVVKCERLPRRRNFLSLAEPNAMSATPKSCLLRTEPRHESFLAEMCTFDSLPLPLARVGLFMPAIFQYIEGFAIAEELIAGPMRNVSFQKLEHVITAISAPAAQRPTDYQRFEFLGDSILKFVVSCHLFVSHPEWHEGFLTLKRSQLVSNTTLSEAAVRTGLPPYIITAAISYKAWKVPVFSSSQQARENRQVSSKTLADVVEALIGAAWVDAGMTASRKSINLFLPTIPPNPTQFITVKPLTEEVNFGNVHDIESLIGYTFSNPILLLEALTHPSCGGHSRMDSYQRLEYLGDAILDMLVAQHMASRLDRLSQGRMTQLKAALVNAQLLGFLCLDTRNYETHRAVDTDAMGQSTETTSTREVHLATFMRAASVELAAAQRESQQRYALHRDTIRRELDLGKQYPWAELMRLRAAKFYSDVIESVLGAIFVDAEGSLSPCMAFIQKLGLKAYMDRLMNEAIDVLHPRDRVQRWAGPRSVSYNHERNELDGRYRCSLLIAEVKVAEVSDCCDREEAITCVASRFEEMLSSGDIDIPGL